MILIADSGSTKTDWAFLTQGGEEYTTFRTEGINPVLLSDEQIIEMLRSLVSKHLHGARVTAVRFYGAGCIPEQCTRVSRLISHEFATNDVEVYSDLLGACHALCGDKAGICCILGTGSASCYYDGMDIRLQTPSLGYILGDEGSGAVLGRRFVSDLLKDQISTAVAEKIFKKQDITISEVISHVYRHPWPNRYLASFAPLIAEFSEDPSIEAMLNDEFGRFVHRNLLNYQEYSNTVHCVGSIAAYFRKYIARALHTYNMELGTICQAPLDALVKYHTPLLLK